ncbi:hypothetical protein ECE50_018440 [Chitinophaga sp. Mgbs1]|uniref:Uncharacterized protein n=1 Tax=Chitinophaga solisilvae TaxID=1233460 RepID=A0A3S1CZ31_9BACT|nr:hypothetical protein [Chitinophaga solisilvae]
MLFFKLSRRPISPLILLLIVSILSCSKEKESRQDSDQKLISDAQKWYSAHTFATGSLNWNDARVIVDNNSQKKVIVPYPFINGLNKGSRSIRRIIFNQKGNDFQGSLLVIIAAPAYSKTHASFNPNDFTGLSEKFDLNMKFQSGGYYEQGVRKYQADFKSFTSQLAYEQKTKTERECVYMYDSYVDRDGVFTVYGYTVCIEEGWSTGGGINTQPPWDGSTESGGGTGGGGWGGPGWEEHWDPEDPRKPKPLPPPSVQTIKSELTNPCLNEIFTATQNAKLTNLIKTTISSVFGGKNSNIDLIFREKHQGDFLDGVLGEYDKVESHVRPASNNNPELVGEMFINLNVDALPSRPKEVIATVILHESLHAYLAQEGIKFELSWVNQHETMAVKYVEKIGAALREIFPNISQTDSEALGWMGLQETMSWSANTFADLKNRDNKFYNKVYPILEYQDGKRGTPSGCQ